MSDHSTPATKHQDEFIGIVCHELKTPLTLLTAIVQLLAKKLSATEATSIKTSLNKAGEQVKKMGNLINGFLSKSFLESGKIDVNKTEFRLDYLIGEIVEETRSLDWNQFVVLDCSSPMIVNADKDKIGCVLSNLLCNAIKYSPQGRCIYVKCFRSPSKVMVRIRDEGIGIKPENLDR
jgi:two-component system sensor histidine kinase VicK